MAAPDGEMSEVFITVLPIPPTANNLFPTSRSGHRFPSKAYKAWQVAAQEAFEKWDAVAVDGPVKARYEFCFGDARRRDIANFEKGVTDFLVSKGIIKDDSLIDHLILKRGPKDKAHIVNITIERAGGG